MRNTFDSIDYNPNRLITNFEYFSLFK